MANILVKAEVKNTRRAVKRKRIRRLVDLDIPEERRKRFRGTAIVEISKLQCCSKQVFITCILILISLVILVCKSDYGFIANFLNHYQEHYHQIVHGNRNYCRHELDVPDIFAKVREDQIILHQEKALNRLQGVLESSRRQSIALVGPVGVGKRLFLYSFLNRFPWPDNVYSYDWSTFERNERQMLLNVPEFIEHFSDCGVNLLIIKNLTPADKNVVDAVNGMIQKENPQRKRFIIFFVFYLNTMLSEPEYLEQHDSLQNLNYTKTINFRRFSRKELDDCIRLELALNNMTVSQNTFHELMDTIDVRRSGCKNVYAKIMTFGRKVRDPSITDNEETSSTT